MKTVKGNGRPRTPYLNQIWYEPVTKSLRRWDGKRWEEISLKDVHNPHKKPRE